MCIYSVYEIAQKISYEHRNRLSSPVETAVWWVEHVIATGGFELGKTNTNDMNWFIYHSFDGISIVLIAMVFTIFCTIRLIGICCRCLKSKSSDRDKKNK